jgi:NADH:ubiquinone oxidoreductase subunit 5 (subunit L)/multisubunit Na+/H+ antiporter MnhA subunit
MDSVQSLLALIVLLAPLVAAAGIAAFGLTRNRRIGRSLCLLGAAVSFFAASTAVLRLYGGELGVQLPLSLGVWLTSGLHDPFQIEFAVCLDLPSACLAAVISLSTYCAIVWNRSGVPDGPSGRLMYIAASLLLASSLGIVLSTNAGELVVFWQVASISGYLMYTAGIRTSPQAAAAKKFVLVHRVAELWLLCAVFALAVGYQTLDFDDLFQYQRLHGVAQRFAFVHFIGLCLLGAAVVRCALYPFLGWAAGLAEFPPLTSALVEGICLMPAGVVLLIRFLPVTDAAAAAAHFAVFLGAASALIAAICAWSETDLRRQAGFACASVFGLIVLGLSLRVTAAAAWSVVLTATFIPTSAAVLGWFGGQTSQGLRERRIGADAAVVSVVILFSGICGQGGIVSAGLIAAGRGSATLGLAVVLAAFAQFFAAFAVTRTLLARRATRTFALPSASPLDEVDFVDRSSVFTGRLASFSAVVLAMAGVLVGFVGGALTLSATPRASAGTSLLTLAGGSPVASLFGCLPALAGFIAGWLRPQSADRPSGMREALLTRLGRHRFYCDGFLIVLFVLPTRGLAQFARFVDWFFIDGFVSGAPASAVETAAYMLEPIQGRSVLFYLTATAVGTALLAAVVVWLR